jgi:hypothetical protein
MAAMGVSSAAPVQRVKSAGETARIDAALPPFANRRPAPRSASNAVPFPTAAAACSNAARALCRTPVGRTTRLTGAAVRRRLVPRWGSNAEPSPMAAVGRSRAALVRRRRPAAGAAYRTTAGAPPPLAPRAVPTAERCQTNAGAPSSAAHVEAMTRPAAARTRGPGGRRGRTSATMTAARRGPAPTWALNAAWSPMGAPKVCAASDCGVIADGCGSTLDCGSCGPRDAGAPG